MSKQHRLSIIIRRRGWQRLVRLEPVFLIRSLLVVRL